MRKLMMAVAATAVLASAALFTDARPANAQSVSQDALKTAFDSGDLHVSYVRRGGGGGGRGGVAVRGGGGRGAVAYRGGRRSRSRGLSRRGRSRCCRLPRGPPGLWPPRLWPAWLWPRLWPPWLSPGLRRRLLWQPVLRRYGYGGAALGLATGAVVGSAIAAQPVYAAPVYGGGGSGGLLLPSATNPTIPAAGPFWARRPEASLPVSVELRKKSGPSGPLFYWS